MKKIVFLIIFLLVIQFSSAEELEPSNNIEIDMIDAGEVILRMHNDNFSIQRINDTLKAATQIYDAQSKLPEGRRDYSIIEQYLEEIFDLESEAYVTKDEIEYVQQTYDQTKLNAPGIDLEGADILFKEMMFEFESERYDRAYDLATETYKKIIELEGQHTALNLAYQSTTKSIKGFIIKNWIIISIIVIAGIILYSIFRNRILYFRIKLKIKKLEKESGVLEELVKQSQIDYFESGTLPESSYKVRIKKFSELIRDINRQLPLLREELMKTKRKELEEAKKERKSKPNKKEAEEVINGKSNNKPIKKKPIKKSKTKSKKKKPKTKSKKKK